MWLQSQSKQIYFTWPSTTFIWERHIVPYFKAASSKLSYILYVPAICRHHQWFLVNSTWIYVHSNQKQTKIWLIKNKNKKKTFSRPFFLLSTMLKNIQMQRSHCPPFVECHFTSTVSLAGAATGIISVSTDVLLRQTSPWYNRAGWLGIKHQLTCHKHVFCRNKSMLIATNIILLQQKFYRNKLTFVATKHVFCCDKHVCRDKEFVTTNICHLKLHFVAIKQAYFRCDKTHLLPQQANFCQDKNDTCGSPRQWYHRDCADY